MILINKTFFVLTLAVLLQITRLTCNSVHGGSYMAMTGKDSIVLAVDTRFATIKTGNLPTLIRQKIQY